MPCGGLVISNGVIHGTTLAGGAGGTGTVFAINTDGSGFLALYDFTATDPSTGIDTDGATPAAGSPCFRQRAVWDHLRRRHGWNGHGVRAGSVLSGFPCLPSLRSVAGRRHKCIRGVSGGSAAAGGKRSVRNRLRGWPGWHGHGFPGSDSIDGTGGRSGESQWHRQRHVHWTWHAKLQLHPSRQANNLTSWQELPAQAADASGSANYPETNLSSPARFYRIKEAPSRGAWRSRSSANLGVACQTEA